LTCSQENCRSRYTWVNPFRNLSSRSALHGITRTHHRLILALTELSSGSIHVQPPPRYGFFEAESLARGVRTLSNFISSTSTTNERFSPFQCFSFSGVDVEAEQASGTPLNFIAGVWEPRLRRMESADISWKRSGKRMVPTRR